MKSKLYIVFSIALLFCSDSLAMKKDETDEKAFDAKNNKPQKQAPPSATMVAATLVLLRQGTDDPDRSQPESKSEMAGPSASSQATTTSPFSELNSEVKNPKATSSQQSTTPPPLPTKVETKQSKTSSQDCLDSKATEASSQEGNTSKEKSSKSRGIQDSDCKTSPSEQSDQSTSPAIPTAEEGTTLHPESTAAENQEKKEAAQNKEKLNIQMCKIWLRNLGKVFGIVVTLKLIKSIVPGIWIPFI